MPKVTSIQAAINTSIATQAKSKDGTDAKRLEVGKELDGVSAPAFLRELLRKEIAAGRSTPTQLKAAVNNAVETYDRNKDGNIDAGDKTAYSAAWKSYEVDNTCGTDRDSKTTGGKIYGGERNKITGESFDVSTIGGCPEYTLTIVSRRMASVSKQKTPLITRNESRIDELMKLVKA